MGSPPLPEAIRLHYEEEIEEARRLTEGLGRLELARTQEIVRRRLPPGRARILDVGGAAGVHAAWLLGDGHRVHLVDPVERHVVQAVEALGSEEGFSAEVGDARALPGEEEGFDAVLLFGPLYHLTERADRIRAWSEARRVVRPNGLVFSSAISRYASLFDGLATERLFDEEFRSIVERDLIDGQHRNPSRRPGWFTTAFFHGPDELEEEALEGGLEILELAGVEGPAAWMPHLASRWEDPVAREVILFAARAVEHVPRLGGLSPHLILVARRR